MILYLPNSMKWLSLIQYIIIITISVLYIIIIILITIIHILINFDMVCLISSVDMMLMMMTMMNDDE